MSADLVEVVGAAIVEAGRCLVARRSATMSSPHAWEFPGGKVEAGESPTEALVRELEEELGVRVTVDQLLGVGEAGAGRRRVRLEVYGASILSGRPEPREHAELRWVGVAELLSLDFAVADRPVLPAVRDLLLG